LHAAVAHGFEGVELVEEGEALSVGDESLLVEMGQEVLEGLGDLVEVGIVAGKVR
jgi:hypothetical protein